MRKSKPPLIDISDEIPVITLDSDSDSESDSEDSDDNVDVVTLEDDSPPKETKPNNLSLTEEHSRIQKLYNVFQLNEEEKLRREDETKEADRFIQMVGSVPKKCETPSDGGRENTSFEDSEEEHEQRSPMRRRTVRSSESDSDGAEEGCDDPIPDEEADAIEESSGVSEEDLKLAHDVHEFTNKFRKRKFIVDKDQLFSTARGDKDRAVLARLWHQLLGQSNDSCKDALERVERWRSQNLPENGGWSSESATGEEHNDWISRMDVTILRAALEEGKFEFKSLEQGHWNFELGEIDKEWRRYRKSIKELLEDFEPTGNSFFTFTHYTIRDIAEKKVDEEQPEKGAPFTKFWIQGLNDLIEQNGKKKTKLVSTFLKRMKRCATVKNALDINDSALRRITEELDKAFDENYHLPKGLLFRQLILNVADIFFYDNFTRNWLIVHPKYWKLLDRIPVDARDIKHLLNSATS